MNIWQRGKRAISELIGNTRRVISLWNNQIWSMRPSFDWTRVDYEFYDKLWRGQAGGLDKSGLLVKPIVSKIVAWMMGRLPKFIIEGDAALEKDVNDWMQAAHARIIRSMLESGKLGDCFLVMNGDGTVSLMPPDVVFPIVDEEDYSKRIGWRVVAVYQHPERLSTMKIIDEYTAERRVRIMQRDGAEFSREEFPNPLGRVPVVLVPNIRGVNDLFGRPEAEPLLPLLHDYGQILDAGLDGNYKQGRPVFTLEFNDVTSMDKFWSLYGKTRRHEMPDGTTEEENYLDVDLEGVVTLANAKGEWKAPGSSASDTTAYLEILYYLLLEHTELPEFLLGTAIASSKASAEVQMPPFVKFIEMRQLLAEDWIIELAQLAAAYLRAVGMRRSSSNEVNVSVMWPRLVDNDNRLTLDTLKWALAAGVIDDENAVRLMPVDIEKPEAMLVKLRAGAAEREAKEAEANNFDKAQEKDAQMWALDDEKIRANGHGNHDKIVELQLL